MTPATPSEVNRAYRSAVYSYIDNILTPNEPFSDKAKENIFQIAHKILTDMRVDIGSRQISNNWQVEDELKDLVETKCGEALVLYNQLFTLMGQVVEQNPHVKEFLHTGLPAHLQSNLTGPLNPHRVTYICCQSVRSIDYYLEKELKSYYSKSKIA